MHICTLIHTRIIEKKKTKSWQRLVQKLETVETNSPPPSTVGKMNTMEKLTLSLSAEEIKTIASEAQGNNLCQELAGWNFRNIREGGWLTFWNEWDMVISDLKQMIFGAPI